MLRHFSVMRTLAVHIGRRRPGVGRHPTIGVLHELPSPGSDFDGTRTPRSWVARMTKRRVPTGTGKRLRVGDWHSGAIHGSRNRPVDHSCVSYHPGHQPHRIQAMKSWRTSPLSTSQSRFTRPRLRRGTASRIAVTAERRHVVRGKWALWRSSRRATELGKRCSWSDRSRCCSRTRRPRWAATKTPRRCVCACWMNTPASTACTRRPKRSPVRGCRRWITVGSAKVKLNIQTGVAFCLPADVGRCQGCR